MPVSPMVTGALLMATATAASIDRGLEAAPWSSDSAALGVVGGWILTIIALAGFLISRGRWSRWLSLGVATMWLAVAASAGLDAPSIIAMVLAAATIAALAGPWPSDWLRHLPSAEGPPLAAVVSMLALVAMPAAVGFGAPGGVAAVDWAIAAWSLLLCALLSRGSPVGLWAVRIVHVPAVVAASIASGLLGTVPALVLAVTAAVGAWHPSVEDATRRRFAIEDHIPIPPELVAPEILEAAGFDDRGAPKDPR